MMRDFVITRFLSAGSWAARMPAPRPASRLGRGVPMGGSSPRRLKVAEAPPRPQGGKGAIRSTTTVVERMAPLLPRNLIFLEVSARLPGVGHLLQTLRRIAMPIE